MTTTPDHMPSEDQIIAAVQRLQDERDQLVAERAAGKGVISSDGHARLISRGPSWAAEVNVTSEAIDYRWGAPTVTQVIGQDGSSEDAPVALTREDMLCVNDTGVAVEPGAARIFVLDENLTINDAVKLARALPECVDRVEPEMNWLASFPAGGDQ